MPRWQQDEADVAAEDWGLQWATLYANDPETARETLGPIRCTLGRVRIMGDGAGSGTVVSQHFPEAFLGRGLVVSCLAHDLTEGQRAWLWVHYVWRWYTLRPKRGKDQENRFHLIRLNRPTKQLAAAGLLGVDERRYYQVRQRVKHRLFEVLQSKTVDHRPEKAYMTA